MFFLKKTREDLIWSKNRCQIYFVEEQASLLVGHGTINGNWAKIKVDLLLYNILFNCQLIKPLNTTSDYYRVNLECIYVSHLQFGCLRCAQLCSSQAYAESVKVAT